MLIPQIDHDCITAIAQDILANVPPFFALAELSMGGITAMEMVRLASGRVTKLALLNTNPLPEARDVAARREPQIQAAQNGYLHTVMRDEMKPNYLSDGSNKAAILDLCMVMAQTLGPVVFTSSPGPCNRAEINVRPCRRLACLLLIMCGEDDILCPLERHTLMYDLIKGSRLVVIPEAGHLPVLEQPDRINNELERWLRE